MTMMAMTAITCTGMRAVQGSGLFPIEPARMGKRHSWSTASSSCRHNGTDHLFAYHNRQPSSSRFLSCRSSLLGETTTPKLPLLGCLHGQAGLCRSHGRRYYDKISTKISISLTGRKTTSTCRPRYPMRATPGSQSTGGLTENGEEIMSNKKQGKGQLGDVMLEDAQQASAQAAEEEEEKEEEEEEEEETDSFVKFMFEPFPRANEEDDSGGLLDTVFDEIGKIFSGADDERSKAMRNVAFWVGAAAAFGALIGVGEGWNKASEFYAG
ncbi:hypothetical protein CBR_g49579 [Chara braunii]|uniref:Uncharacterized protein n=1 Tax=Chara braunii TaxID=69332 RepID=A0A388M568_CHABU|nr:hypothetical protein CBR_g49579 [Chara braunii]|eukprot:GBG89727.1 hypothetical protein CBR_g49579 [Chara braunii]